MEIQMDTIQVDSSHAKESNVIKFDNIYRIKNSVFYECGIFILCCIEFYAYGIWLCLWNWL